MNEIISKFFIKKYRLFDIILLFIIFVSLFTAHLDVVRFANVFKDIYFCCENLNYNNWDLPWYLAQKYPYYDFPYSILMLLITSFPFYLYQLFFNHPTELFLIVLAKIPIIVTLIIFYSFLKIKEIRKINLLLLLISPQIIIHQVLGGQYDIIVYVILYIGLIRILDNIQDSKYIFIRFVFISSFVGFIKLSGLVVSLPVSIFLFMNYFHSVEKRQNFSWNKIIKMLSIFVISYAMPFLSDFVLRHSSLYYSAEVGSASLLIDEIKLKFIIFTVMFIFLLLLSTYAGIRINRSYKFDNFKDITLILLIMSGLCFSHPHYSYGWASIVSIGFVGLSSLTTNNLKIYFYIYLLSFFLFLCVTPNSLFFDILGPIKNYIENERGLYGYGMGFIYRSISSLSESLALSVKRFSEILYLISALIFYQKSFRRITFLLKR